MNYNVYRSVDGTNWEGLLLGDVGDVAVGATDVNRLFAIGKTLSTGYQYVMTLWRSTTGGKDWSSMTVTDVPSCGQALALDSGSVSVIYAGGVKDNNGPILLKSSDDGMTWEALGAGTIEGQVLKVAVHPQTPLLVLAGTTVGSYLSADGGVNWVKALSGETREILFDPDVPSDVYVAGASGIWRSRDYGVSWEAFSPDADSSGVLSLTANWSQRVFYVGTEGNSIRRKKFVETTFVYPPVSLTAIAHEVRSVLQREYVGELTWRGDSRNTNIAKYRIYLIADARKTLLGEVESGTQRFLHRKVSFGATYFYSVTAVDRNGREGGGAFANLNFSKFETSNSSGSIGR